MLIFTVSSDALGLKARVYKRGEFPTGGVAGEVPPSIIYVGGNSGVHLENLLFTLCECFFAAKNK